MEGKNIKVYGTLINQTQNTNSSMRDSQHNDLIAVAYQLFDERFTPKKGSGANGAVINIDRYQDIINKRLTAIDYDPNGNTTNIYSNLYVDGDTNIGGDLTVEGDTTFEGDVNITGDINLDMGLNDLNDVTLSTMAIGQVLRYNGSEWVNAKLSIDDLEMPAATAGQVLKFNGTKWVAGTDETGGGGVSRLSDLTDVNVSNVQDGQVLKYDANSQKWVAGPSANENGSGVVYRKYTVTLTKVAQRNGIVDKDSYDSNDDLRGRIYPGQNNAYFYVSDSPLVLGSGETLYQQYISLSQFETVPYIKTFSQNYELAHPNGTESTVATLDGNSVVDGAVPSATNRYFLSNTLSTTTFSQKPYTDSLDCTFNNQNASMYYTFASRYVSWNTKKGDFYCPLFSGPYRQNVSAEYTDPTHNLEVQVIENGLIYTYTGYPNDAYKYSAEYVKYTQSVNSSNRHTVTATTVSQSDIINKLKLTNNSIFVEVGANKVFAGIIASSDYSMPNTITAVITTQEIIGVN